LFILIRYIFLGINFIHAYVTALKFVYDAAWRKWR